MSKILVKYPKDFKSIKISEFHPEAALMDIITGGAAAVEKPTSKNFARKSSQKSVKKKKLIFCDECPKGLNV
jgi:hypothetical protein